MLAKLSARRPSHTTVVAYLALFLAVGGGTTAMALQGRNTVDSGDIINQEVKSADLLNDSVQGVDVRFDSLTGGDVANGSLKGDDIDESSLGQVPRAASANTANTAGSADNADTVDGLHARSFSFNVNAAANPSKRTLFTLGGLTLKAACGTGDFLSVWAATNTDDSYLRSTVGGLNTSASDFDAGTDYAVFGSDQDNAGVMSYRRGADPSLGADVVTVTFAYDTNPTGNDCQLSGTAIGK